MSKENLTMFEQVIDSEKGEEREFYLKGLKDMIGKLEKDADEDLKKEIGRLKTKFSIGGAKKSPAPKKSPAKKPTAKRTTKPKTTKEEREKKKAEVKDATGKTIEECKEILAKYEAMRLKTNKEQKERVSELKKKDEIIDGTNVKTADATTKTTAKEVAPKIKKEVEQIEKEAEREAKKVVKPQGKTATEVKKQVEKKKDEIIEKKVEDMTKDLASASANFVKSVQSEIAKFSKDDAKKFLIDLRKQIDVLLRAYGYGGELSAGVQAYEIPWAGGGRPTMFAKGGNIKNKSYINAIIDSSDNGKYEKQITSLLDEHFIDYYVNRHNANGVVYEIAEPRDGQFEDDVKSLIRRINKGKKSMDIYFEYQDINNWDYFSKGGVTASSDIIDIAIYWLDENEPLQGENYSINSRQLSKKLKSGKRDKQTIAELMDMLYSNGQNDDTAIELDGYSVLVYGEEGVDDYIRGEDIYYAIDEDKYAKGGKTRSLRSIRTDRARLSKEPWEQAYKSKRKGSYYAKGGGVGNKDYVEDRISNLKSIVSKMQNYLNTDLEENSEDAFRNREKIRQDMNKFKAEILHLEDELSEFAKGGKTWVQDVTSSKDFRHGAFSRKAEARGLDTEDFMNQVLHNPSYYDETTRRQAQFMKNAFNY